MMNLRVLVLWPSVERYRYWYEARILAGGAIRYLSLQKYQAEFKQLYRSFCQRRINLPFQRYLIFQLTDT